VRVSRLSDEVLVADQDPVTLSAGEVATLKEQAASTERGRVRVCAHTGSEDTLHEMVIVLDRATYVRPHRHPGKSESFHAIEGAADIVLFDEQGEIEDVIAMGDYASGRVFFYRLNSARFHTVLVRTDRFVVHETTNGPFDRSETVEAAWAPAEEDLEGRAEYLRELDRRLGAAPSR
jgi:cupin fold WbuC family metalloprotein